MLNTAISSCVEINEAKPEPTENTSKASTSKKVGTLSYGSTSSFLMLPGLPITALTPTLSDSSKSVTYTISPSLPQGLSLNSTSGIISGTPTTKSASTSYTVTATRSDSDYLTGSITLAVGNQGTGADGDLVVSAAGQVVNKYATIVTPSVSAGSTTFNVYNSTQAAQFSAGDQILVIQMQNTATNLFNQEYAQVKSVSGSQIEITSGLTYSYSSNTYNNPAPNPVPNPAPPAGYSAAAKIAQIVRIPQYKNVTIQAGGSIVPQAWDGMSGGIILFRVSGDLSVAGSINASGYGYRGGGGAGDAFTGGWPYTGESWNGTGYMTSNFHDNSSVAANNGGGGAGRMNGSPARCTNSGYADGGFGGYGTAGSSGLNQSNVGNVGLGGGAYGSAALTQLFLGSGGGGAVGDNCGICYQWIGSSASGGGIIAIFVGGNLTVSGAGLITAAGGNGGNPGCTIGLYAGGSGGSIYLSVGKQISLTNNSVVATGGLFWNSSSVGGGQGRIRVDANTVPASGFNPTPGYTGTP